MRPLVVVIPTYGRPALLERTLESLAAAGQPPGYAFTCIAENGGTQPEVARIVARAPASLRVRLQTMPDGNKSAALNAVLATLSNELVVFLDDDVRVAPAMLEGYAAADEARGDRRAFFGGPMGVDYESAPPDWLRVHLPPSAVGWTWHGDPALVDRPEFLGCNWAARVEDLKAMGGFDPAFGPGAPTGATGQERDMQRRLLEAGYLGYFVPEAFVWHFVPRDRCSRGWALRRAFRNGVSEGLNTRNDATPRVAGIPRWMVRMAAGKALAAVGAQFGRSPQARFSAARDFVHFTGRLKGMRVAITQGHE